MLRASKILAAALLKTLNKSVLNFISRDSNPQLAGHKNISKKDSSDHFKRACRSYLSIVSVLPTVDDGRHAPSLEKQQRSTGVGN